MPRHERSRRRCRAAKNLATPARETLESAYSGRDNAFGFMRLCFALLVVVAHTGVLGWGPGHEPVVFPVDVGGVAVAGFFGLSGFLISRSGRRLGARRFVWHRVLRIFPGYWVCLAVTGFVAAPLLFWHDHHTLHHFRDAGPGPLGYVYRNFLTDQNQPDVAGVTSTATYPGVFNGSLWTLKSELTCYLLVLLLAATGILRRARWLVLVLGAVLLGMVAWNALVDPAQAPVPPGSVVHVPGLGAYLTFYLLMFGVAFVLGVIADLYRTAIPVNDVLGVVSVLLWCTSLAVGWPLFGPGIAAFVYMLLWLGVRIPKLLRGVGRRNDYSYGVYIYAFPIQQTLAVLGLPRYGIWVYTLASAVAAFTVAVLSWHFVEKPAMWLKDWTPDTCPGTARRDDDI